MSSAATDKPNSLAIAWTRAVVLGDGVTRNAPAGHAPASVVIGTGDRCTTSPAFSSRLTATKASFARGSIANANRGVRVGHVTAGTGTASTNSRAAAVTSDTLSTWTPI